MTASSLRRRFFLTCPFTLLGEKILLRLVCILFGTNLFLGSTVSALGLAKVSRGCRAALGAVSGRIEFDRPELDTFRDEEYVTEVGRFVSSRFLYFRGTPVGWKVNLSARRRRSLRPLSPDQFEQWAASYPHFRDIHLPADFKKTWNFWLIYRPGSSEPVGLIEVWTLAGNSSLSFDWNVRVHFLPMVSDAVVYSRSGSIDLVGDSGISL